MTSGQGMGFAQLPQAIVQRIAAVMQQQQQRPPPGVPADRLAALPVAQWTYKKSEPAVAKAPESRSGWFEDTSGVVVVEESQLDDPVLSLEWDDDEIEFVETRPAEGSAVAPRAAVVPAAAPTPAPASAGAGTSPSSSPASHTESAEDHTCRVCLEKYEEGEQVMTLPCFHRFHVDCIKPWLAKSTKCPMCKIDVVTGK